MLRIPKGSSSPSSPPQTVKVGSGDKGKLFPQNKDSAPLQKQHKADSFEQQEQQLNRYPRKVSRVDSCIDSPVGTYKASNGKPKTRRDPDTGDLMPAGTGQRPDGRPVTAKDHLLGSYPVKGYSSRSSFTNEKKAQDLRDYTNAPETGEQPPVKVLLKPRKLMRARLKGKEDALDARVHTTNDLLRQIDAETEASLKGKKPGSKAANKLREEQKTTKMYARRDAEVQVEGTIPRRYLSYSDRQQSPNRDSDSDSESIDTNYSSYEDDKT